MNRGLGPVDLPHPAGPQLLEKLVRPKSHFPHGSTEPPWVRGSKAKARLARCSGLFGDRMPIGAVHVGAVTTSG